MVSIKKYIAWGKLFFNRSQDWISFFQFLMITTIFSQLLKVYLNLSFFQFTIITIFSVFGVSIVLGYLDFNYGVYKLEFERKAYVNPFYARSIIKWKRTLRKLEEIEKRMDKIKAVIR